MGGVVDRGIDDNGHELHGGIALARDTFVKATNGELICLDATMTYADGNAQLFGFSGRYKKDGSPFHVEIAVPPGAPLGAYIKRVARALIEPPEEG